MMSEEDIYESFNRVLDILQDVRNILGDIEWEILKTHPEYSMDVLDVSKKILEAYRGIIDILKKIEGME